MNIGLSVTGFLLTEILLLGTRIRKFAFLIGRNIHFFFSLQGIEDSLMKLTGR